MKKYILTLLSVIFVALSYAQSSGNTLRFYSDNSSYNHSVKASEIDSITYDYDYQLQKVYANEKILSFPLSEVDSVVFQDKLNYTIVNEIVDGMDGIFAEDGKVLLYGEDSEGNNVMQYSEFDFVTKTWKEESMFVIQVNDDGMPISFITKDLAYVLTYNSGGSFDVISFNENGTCEVIATNLSISNKSRAYGVRRAPSFGDVGGWVGNGLTVWNLISEIKAGGVALSTGLNALGALVGFGSATGGFLIGGTGDILALLKSGASGFYGGALTLATYLAQKSREFQLNHLGDWKISVISVQQKTRTQCEVTYSIAGINIDIEGNPRHRLLLRDPQNKYTTYDLGVAENGVFTKLIDISSPGDYSVEMSLYDECHKFIRQLTYPAAKFYMADLGIEKVEVRDYYYADEMVTYDLSIFLSGDKESLYDTKEYGYYIRYRDSYDYQFTEVNLSTIFASTESTKSLAIAKNLFEMDYSNFKAECTDYKVGAYVILKDGTLIFFDEQDIEFIYDEHPEVHTGEASSVSQTQATVKCEFKDCLFWNVLRGVEYFTSSESESILLDANKEDGEYDFHLDGLAPNTTYNYRAYYEVDGVREYGDMKYFKTEELELCPDHNHPHMIDLGLPSGTKWACCNVGASVPEDCGGYYAWGETEEKSNYHLNYYKYWFDYDADGYGTDDEFLFIGNDISSSNYDAAKNKWGSHWKMPTLVQIEELIKYCKVEWYSVNGRKGLLFCGNGKYLFIPAVGYKYTVGAIDFNSGGAYWTANSYPEDSKAYQLSFGSNGVGIASGWGWRANGQPIRSIFE